jgi:multidrug efflux system membrane fusion protein
MSLKVFFILPLILLSSCTSKPKTLPPHSFPVKTTQVVEKEVPIYIEALGHVDPITSIELKSRIEGELTGVFFEQGQEVRKGDLLFTIDPKPYQASLLQAKGVLEQNLANLALSEEKVKRYRLLTREEFYSQIDYETLQANFAADSALVQQAKAEVDSAAINLDYCWIYAPIDGLMGILKVDFGNLVSADGTQSLATLNQMTPIYVTFSVPEVRLPEIQKYKKLGTLKTMAAFEDFSGPVFEGTLHILDNQVDAGTGMIRLRATFENTTRELWPGQFIRTRLVLTTEPHALVIPYTAVQLTLSGPIAFVVRENMTVEPRALKLGPRQDEQVIVVSGLKKGETVVLEGQLNLSLDAKVYIPEGSSP